MQNKKDLLKLLNTENNVPSSGLRLKELKNKNRYYTSVPKIQTALDTLTSAYGETRDEEEIVADLLYAALYRHNANEIDFLKSGYGDRYDGSLDLRFSIGTLELASRLFNRKKKYAITISDNDLRCHSLINARPGLEHQALSLALIFARQFLMQSRTVFIIDDEKNKALSEASLQMFHKEFRNMPIYDWPSEEDVIIERICENKRFNGQENIVYATGLSATSILSKVANRTFHSHTANLSPCLIISVGEEYKEIDKMALPAQLRGMRMPVIHVSPNRETWKEYANILNYFWVEIGDEDGKTVHYVEQSRHHRAGKVSFSPLESPKRMNSRSDNTDAATNATDPITKLTTSLT